ncbi:MAG: hypothetical protein KC416_11625 [Myxococcales bacterium]|nr:hypothetical protein [Myxococcales bacterium]
MPKPLVVAVLPFLLLACANGGPGSIDIKPGDPGTEALPPEMEAAPPNANGPMATEELDEFDKMLQDGFADQDNRDLALKRGELEREMARPDVKTKDYDFMAYVDDLIALEQNRRAKAGQWPTATFVNPDLKDYSTGALEDHIHEANTFFRKIDGRTRFSASEQEWILIGAIVAFRVQDEMVDRGAYIVPPVYILSDRTRDAVRPQGQNHGNPTTGVK